MDPLADRAGDLKGMLLESDRRAAYFDGTVLPRNIPLFKPPYGRLRARPARESVTPENQHEPAGRRGQECQCHSLLSNT